MNDVPMPRFIPPVFPEDEAIDMDVIGMRLTELLPDRREFLCPLLSWLVSR